MSSRVVPFNKKTSHAKTELKVLTVAEMETWQLPPFQARLKINSKVKEVAEELKVNGGFIAGIIHLGYLADDIAQTSYLVDGQHRRAAAGLSELSEFIAEVHTKTYETMAEMASDFYRLNTYLSKKQPDDILRALEMSIDSLKLIREKCPYVGYDNVRRSSNYSPLVSMAALLRCWRGSDNETPAHASSITSSQLAYELTMEDAAELVQFLATAYSAWGRDIENYRLWTALNMTMCMWLWRKIVRDTERASKRYAHISVEQYKQCLMMVSSSRDYIDWLVGRHMSERDRLPCYRKLRELFVRSLKARNVKNTKMPQPRWAQAV